MTLTSAFAGKSLIYRGIARVRAVMGRYWWEMALLVTFRRHESVILTWKRQMWYTGSDRYRKAWNMQIAAGTGRDTAGLMRFASLRHLSSSYSAKNAGPVAGTLWENGDLLISKEISRFPQRRERMH